MKDQETRTLIRLPPLDEGEGDSPPLPSASRSQGPKDAARLAKGEAPGSCYDYEDRINFAVFPSLQVRRAGTGVDRWARGTVGPGNQPLYAVH